MESLSFMTRRMSIPLKKNGGPLILPTAFYSSKEEIIADLPRLVLQAGRQPVSASALPLLV